MSDRDDLQHEARPFGPQPDEKKAQMFNQAPCEVDGYLPPLETVEERRARDPRGLQGQQLELFFQERFSHELTLAELYPYRLKAYWRIVREWAALIGLVSHPSETLREACLVEPSPWTYRKLVYANRSPKDAHMRKIIEEAEGLSLLPPAPPDAARGRPDYTPRRDYKLRKWCELVHYLGTTRLALGQTMEGRYGLAGLNDPDYARLATPSPAEVCALEDLMVRKALELLVQRNRQAVVESIRNEYGLFDHEIDQVLAMAHARAAEHGRADKDAVRGLNMLRLEKILDDFHERMDGRGALLALREIAKIAGLDADTEAEATVEDMANVARLTNTQTKKGKKLPPPPPV